MKKECDFCGAENEDWMEICINCGNKLNKTPDKEEAKDVKPPEPEKPKVIRTTNPNGTLILVLGISVVIFIVLLVMVISKYS
jgi:uncharacterized membrane protein YvbJ